MVVRPERATVTGKPTRSSTRRSGNPVRADRAVRLLGAKMTRKVRRSPFSLPFPYSCSAPVSATPVTGPRAKAGVPVSPQTGRTVELSRTCPQCSSHRAARLRNPQRTRRGSGPRHRLSYRERAFAAPGGAQTRRHPRRTASQAVPNSGVASSLISGRLEWPG